MKLNKKGFTLVELLAVIVILALLMVVATRSIGSVLTSSRKSAMDTEIKKLISNYNTYSEQLKIDKNTSPSGIISNDAAYSTKTGNTTYIVGTDGDYEFYINTSSAADFCISDKSNGSAGTFSGNTITYTAATTTAPEQQYVSNITTCSK